MSYFRRLLAVNPIAVKEIRSRMRGPRAFITLTLVLLIIGGIMYGVLQIILANARYSTVLSPRVGQALFATLAYLELFSICAITPAVTSGAISGEKEKLTYEMLMATPLSPTSILWGKLVSALSYVFLLLLAGIPLASMIFIFGGVAPGEMFKVFLVLLVIAVSLGVLGVFMSTLFSRTGRATVASFLVVVAAMLGPLFIAVLYTALRQGQEPPRWILIPSPVSALAAALTGSFSYSNGGEVFYVLSGIFNMGVSPISQTSIPRPLYHFSLPFYTLISVILFMLSTRLLQATQRWRIRPKELIFGILILLVVAALIAAGFLLSANRYEWAGTPLGIFYAPYAFSLL